LEDPPGLFDLSQAALGLVFSAAVLAVQFVIAADATDGLLGPGRLEVALQPASGPAGKAFFERDDLSFRALCG